MVTAMALVLVLPPPPPRFRARAEIHGYARRNELVYSWMLEVHLRVYDSLVTLSVCGWEHAFGPVTITSVPTKIGDEVLCTMVDSFPPFIACVAAPASTVAAGCPQLPCPFLTFQGVVYVRLSRIKQQSRLLM